MIPTAGGRAAKRSDLFCGKVLYNNLTQIDALKVAMHSHYGEVEVAGIHYVEVFAHYFVMERGQHTLGYICFADARYCASSASLHDI